MEYRLPTIEDESVLKAYVSEHHENGEQSVSASLGLPVTEYGEWVARMCVNAVEGDPEWGRSLLYLCFEAGRLVGLLSIRYELPDELSKKYGDIGYGVRPSERRKGYAERMLRYAMRVCRDKGMERVRLGCYKDNIASMKVILKCGGVPETENMNYKADRVSCYYTIDL